MATVIKRTWLSKGPTGHRVRRIAYGYTLQMNGKQERKFAVNWLKEDAQNALAARQQNGAAVRAAWDLPL